jgi:thiol-disulfide isomerase/thioredoxin
MAGDHTAKRMGWLLSGLVGVGALFVVWVLFSATLQPGSESDGLAKGEMAKFVFAQDRPALPESGFLDGSGEPVSITDFRGRVVLLNLWATWCAPCIEEMPELDRLEAELGGDAFEVVAVSLDKGGLEQAGPFLKELGVEDLALYADPTTRLGPDLRAPGLPITVLVDRSGREIGRVTGLAKWDSADARRLIGHFVDGG